MITLLYNIYRVEFGLPEICTNLLRLCSSQYEINYKWCTDYTCTTTWSSRLL